ncbi:hypothetical protein ACFLTK_03900 [Chloroflexota bacterium]
MGQSKFPVSQIVFGEIIYWLCVLSAIVCMIGPVIALLSVDGNIMNPHYLFASIFEGNTVDVVWNEVGGGFPGGHFWREGIFTGDGFTQFGLVIGCASALPALIATALVYAFRKKERAFVWVFFSLVVAALCTISISGLFSF